MRREPVEVPRLKLHAASVKVVPAALFRRPVVRPRIAVEQSHAHECVEVAGGCGVVARQAVEQRRGERRMHRGAPSRAGLCQVVGDERRAFRGRQQEIIRAQVGEDGVVGRRVVGCAGARIDRASEGGAGGLHPPEIELPRRELVALRGPVAAR